MFNCSYCENTSLSGEKPIRVVQQTRPKLYHNEYMVEDDMGNKRLHKVDSEGREIVSEVLACTTCAEKEFGIAKPAIVKEAKAKLEFREPLAEPLAVKLLAIVVHSALDRVNQAEERGSKRAKRDSAVAIPMIKSFLDGNTNFVF